MRRLVFAVSLLVAFVAFVAGASARGELTTGPSSVGVADSQFFGVAAQSDGKLVAVGETGMTGGSTKLLVARFNVNGTVDASFGKNGVVIGGGGTLGRAVAVAQNGTIVVAGRLTNAHGDVNTGMLLVRLSGTGSLLGVSTALTGQAGQASAIAVQRDGKIVLAGSAQPSGGGADVSALARFNGTGSPDGSFGGGSGTVVANLGAFSTALGVAVQSDGKIVIAGSQRADLQIVKGLAARFNPNGSLDGSFSGGAFLQDPVGGSGAIVFNAVTLQGANIVLAGATPTLSGANAIVERLTSSGARDGSFNGGGIRYLPSTDPSSVLTPPGPDYPGAYGVAISGPDIVVAGHFDQLQLEQLALWGIAPNGALDSKFGSGGRTLTPIAGSFATGENLALALAPDGSLLTAGKSTQGINQPTGLAARYNGSAAIIKPPPKKPPPPRNRVERIGSVISHGLRFSADCARACRVQAVLSVSNATARRIGLLSRRSHNHGSVIVGRLTVSYRKRGHHSLSLHLSAAARRAFGRQGRVDTTLRIGVRTGSRTVSSSQAVTLVKR